MIDALEKALSGITRQAAPTRVATTTVLPSGALATVTVRPSQSGEFSVSDERAGPNDLLALGYHDLTGHDRKRGSEIAERLGLVFSDGEFSVRRVSADQLTGAIIFVAEAAREWASTAAENAAKRLEVALSRRVEERLKSALPKAKISREVELAGGSTKRHRFDLVLELGRERKAVFEVVTPNANSLSAAHLKMFDLKDAHPEWPREAITERLEDWSSADMALLAGVATHVRAMDREWKDLPAFAE